MEKFFKNKAWIKTGLFFGLLMFLILTLAFSILRWQIMSIYMLLINLFINLLGGLVYGFLMKLYFKFIATLNKQR
ncbi:MAG: hypothetical protein Q4B43_01925 [Bacteroidota bacterium]|nr:hypothetical protein [Bacteroidota bacterium]